MRPAAGHPAPVALLYVYLAAAVAGSASDGSVSFARDGGVGCQLPEFSGGMEPGNCSKFFQNGTSVYELPSGARCSPVCSPGTGLVVRGGLSPARFQQLQGRDIAEQGRYACEDGKLVSNFTEYFQCKFCYADKYQPSYKATPCIACGDHAGTKDPSGNDIYGSFTYQSCKCSPGYFNDVNHLNSKGSKGSMICMPCPPGTFKNDWGDGHKNYKHWPNGNVELVGNSCYNCSRGNYTADWSSTQCIRCPGDAPTVGAARSVADCFCPSGHYRRLNTTTTLLPRNTSASAAWNAGYSAEDLLSPSECHECPIGRYRNATNASGDTNACLQCPGGIRQSTLRAGSDSCVCASGFSPRQDQPWTRFRRSTQQDTVDADIGYIEDDGGPCVTCGYGYYKSVGNFKCTACPPSKTTYVMFAVSADACEPSSSAINFYADPPQYDEDVRMSTADAATKSSSGRSNSDQTQHRRRSLGTIAIAAAALILFAVIPALIMWQRRQWRRPTGHMELEDYWQFASVSRLSQQFEGATSSYEMGTE